MKKIAVIGSGTMGNGIAHVFAQNGFEVSMIDIRQQALDKAITTISSNLDRMISKGAITEDLKNQTLANIKTHTEMKAGVAGCDLVVEAATENLNIKLDIFRELDQTCDPHTILASNTSSISITKIASVTKRGDKVIVPVEVNDYPGFIANRILMPMINEAICSLYEGVAGVEEIDTVMKLGMAHPMGPLQLADFIGLDVCLSILHVMHDGFGNPKYAPCPLLVNMVVSGNLGKKSGCGFYDYSSGGKELVVAKFFKK